ncbi:MAG: hypothetical protein WA432_02455 [Candidatus Babeliaceae bacterium]
MILIPAEKSNIAWFKLAEFVMRKEKERALGVYRLLEHSFHNEAFAKQLEADLLAAFHDEKACEKYQKTAHLYEQKEQYIQALIMYEKTLTFSLQLAIISKIIHLANKIHLMNKLFHYAKLFITSACQQGLFQQASELSMNLTLTPPEKTVLHETCITTALEAHCTDVTLLSYHVTQVSSDYIKNKQFEKLHALLQHFEQKYPFLYAACQNNQSMQAFL